ACAGDAGPRRTPSPPRATSRCARPGAAMRARSSSLRSRLVEEGERLEAAGAVRLAARRRYHRAGQPQAVALSEAVGLEDPVAQHRQALLDAGGARLLPIDPQLA